MKSAEIAQRLIATLEADNGSRQGSYLESLVPAKRAELLSQLERGVELMLAAGCEFSDADIALMAAGAQDKLVRRFNGYEQASEALDNIFSPEEAWISR